MLGKVKYLQKCHILAEKRMAKPLDVLQYQGK